MNNKFGRYLKEISDANLELEAIQVLAATLKGKSARRAALMRCFEEEIEATLRATQRTHDDALDSLSYEDYAK